MKRILILRHAKSSWADTDLADFDRPLNQRGRRDAPLMAARLRGYNAAPDLILCSTAQRAQETAELFCASLGFPAEALRLLDELYLASAPQLLAAVREYSDTAASVMLIAHNPGLTDLLNQAGDQGIDNLPTCGLAAIDLDINEWAALPQLNAASRFGPAVGRTAFIDYPKKNPT